MSDKPPRRMPGLGGDPSGPKPKPKAGPQPTDDDDIFMDPDMAAGNYPWSRQNRANPVPVIPDLWRSKPAVDDNPFRAEPTPAKATPDPIRPQQSSAGASPGMPKLTLAQIVKFGSAGPTPTVPGRGPTRTDPARVDIPRPGPVLPTGFVPPENPRAPLAPGRGPTRVDSAGSVLSTGGVPLPTGGVALPTGGVALPTGGASIGLPRPADPVPARGSTPALADLFYSRPNTLAGVQVGTPQIARPVPARGSTPEQVDIYGAGPIPTGVVPVGTSRTAQPAPARGSTPGLFELPYAGLIPTSGDSVGPPRPAHPAPPHPGTVRFGPALANRTCTMRLPSLGDLHESWMPSLVSSPKAPEPNPFHSGPASLPANQLAIASRNVYSQPPPRSPVRGRFHHFWVVTHNTDIEALDLLAELKCRNYFTVIGPFLTELNTSGSFHIGFTHLIEAQLATEWFEQVGWDVTPVSVTDFNEATRFAFPTPPDLNDMVYVRVYCGPQSAIDAGTVERLVRPILTLVGEIFDLMRLDTDQPDDPSVVRYYELAVVYANIDHALNAVRALNGVRTEELVLEVMPGRENSHFATSTKARHEFEVQMRGSRRGSSRRGNKSSRRPPLTPRAFDPQASPTRGEPEYMINENEIMYGIDSRTSVMCRNIPHKMTWRELKSILDLSSAGRYNYLYLRINFGDNHNVGYAFVNFESAADILPFFRARAGQVWPGFEQFTDRIAEITYADVQGYGTLVERFRNSPVILNHPDNRPKLFHTSGPRVGAEALFPPVNNFYTLSQGVYRSQNDSGPRPNLTPRSYLGGTPRTPARRSAPAEDDQAAMGGFQPRTPGTGSAFRSPWPAKDRRAGR